MTESRSRNEETSFTNIEKFDNFNYQPPKYYEQSKVNNKLNSRQEEPLPQENEHQMHKIM